MESEKIHINNIMEDIENEFKELDDILKDVDTFSSIYGDQEEEKNSGPNYAPGD